jgi:hypothetical protein
MGLAALIWRRSVVALALASLLFLADSGIFAYGIFKLFQLLWGAVSEVPGADSGVPLAGDRVRMTSGAGPGSW